MNNKNTRRTRKRVRELMGVKNDKVAYEQWVESMTRYLRGCCAGSAVDIIVAYARTPDLSHFQLERLIQELSKLR